MASAKNWPCVTSYSCGRVGVYIYIYILRTSEDQTRKHGFTVKKARSRRHPLETIANADYADDLKLLPYTYSNLISTL